MTPEEHKLTRAERKERLERLMKIAEENLTIKKMMDGTYIKEKRAERAEKEKKEEEKLKAEQQAKIKEAEKVPFVLENWERAKRGLNTLTEQDMIMKRKVSEDVYKKNQFIQRKYDHIVWQAIESFVRTGNMPPDHWPLDIPGIINELKPTKEHLTLHRLHRFISASFLDLSNTEDLQKFYSPKNMEFKLYARPLRKGKINVPE